MRILVTAGNTREKIDAVRDWGNIFTGNTGFAIAQTVAAIAPVDLLTSNREHIEESRRLKPANRMSASGFTSHSELRAALAALMARQKYDAVFMTAAVADYRPARVYSVVKRESTGGEEHWIVRDAQAGKVKSTHQEIAVLGERTEKIVDLFRTEWHHTGLLVKFKLEVGIDKDELIRIGQASRVASNANYLVANTLEMVEGNSPGAYLISESATEWVPRAELSSRMAALVDRIA